MTTDNKQQELTELEKTIKRLQYEQDNSKLDLLLSIMKNEEPQHSWKVTVIDVCSDLTKRIDDLRNFADELYDKQTALRSRIQEKNKQIKMLKERLSSLGEERK